MGRVRRVFVTMSGFLRGGEGAVDRGGGLIDAGPEVRLCVPAWCHHLGHFGADAMREVGDDGLQGRKKGEMLLNFYCGGAILGPNKLWTLRGSGRANRAVR